MKRLITLCIMLLGTSAWADSVSLTVMPSQFNVNPGQVVSVTVEVSGIGSAGAQEVGSFDMYLGFDRALVVPTGVTFTNFLGDPSLGNALTTSAFGPHWVDAADVSFLSNAALEAMQPQNFVLATYSFVGVGTGAASFEFLGGPVDDGNGKLIAGTKEFVPVPEPGSFVLLGFGAVVGSFALTSCARKWEKIRE